MTSIKAYIKTSFRLFFAVFTAMTLSITVNGQDEDAGPWSVIYEGFGYPGSDTDEGGSSTMGSEGSSSGVPGFDDDVEDYNEVPVDGGLSLLLAAGAAYGARRLRRRRQEDDRS